MRFKVGNIITGKKSADTLYSYTTSRAVMEVIKVMNNEILVKIISHETIKKCIEEEFTVYPEYFILLSSSEQSNYIESDQWE